MTTDSKKRSNATYRKPQPPKLPKPKLADLPLTPRQREFFAWFGAYVAQTGQGPTSNEMLEAGFASPQDLTRALEEKGYLQRRPGARERVWQLSGKQQGEAKVDLVGYQRMRDLIREDFPGDERDPIVLLVEVLDQREEHAAAAAELSRVEEVLNKSGRPVRDDGVAAEVQRVDDERLKLQHALRTVLAKVLDMDEGDVPCDDSSGKDLAELLDLAKKASSLSTLARRGALKVVS